MADETTKITTGRLRHFDRAIREKWNKYTWSGLAVLLAGLLVLIINMTFFKTAYPTNMLLIGLGILLIIIGVIRILIGFITPATPLDTISAPAVDMDTALQQELMRPDPGTE
jgi:branched-subunit amino acid ABC-type transport system permease component